METRAWVKINGDTEVNVQRTFEKTGTRFMTNYYTQSAQYLTSLDQSIVDHVTARYTASRNKTTSDKYANDNIFGIYFNTGF
jgi:hypothetical protein